MFALLQLGLLMYAKDPQKCKQMLSERGPSQEGSMEAGFRIMQGFDLESLTKSARASQT